jgi:hypothetical protein
LRRQIQLLPLVLPAWLNMSKFNKVWSKDLLQVHKTNSSVLEAVCSAVDGMARAYRFVFAESYTDTPTILSELNQCIKCARQLMQRCFEGVRGTTFSKTSNFHAAEHTSETARLFGLPKLVSCARGEAKHCAVRAVNRQSNHKFEEYDMLLSQNVRQGVTFLLTGGTQHLRGVQDLYPPHILSLLEQDTTLRKLLTMSGANETYVARNEGDALPQV